MTESFKLARVYSGLGPKTKKEKNDRVRLERHVVGKNDKKRRIEEAIKK